MSSSQQITPVPNATSAVGSNMDPMSSLYPALIQTFTVILCGYLAGRLGIISSSQAKGIGTYVTKFALPAVFFRVMVSIDFGNVSWKFVVAVSLAKLVMFVIAIFFVLLLSRPVNIGLAGIVATFTTQSNDVALGYPILASLFPAYANYIYLFAPTQLVLLNTFSFVLMEWHVQHSTGHPDGKDVEKTMDPQPTVGWGRRLFLVLKNVCVNPLVFMTVIGVIFNFILHHHIPLVVDNVLAVFANSFSATALFYLGIGMVGKMGQLDRRGIYILVFILLAKLIFLPFLTREIVNVFHPGHSENETTIYNTVGFLYGCLPTAPPVFLFASQYQLVPDVIATGLVLGTFLSAPIMFISARLVTIPVYSESDYDYLLSNTSFDTAILSIVCCIWVFGIFILSRRICRVPHSLTVCLLIHIFFSCVGLIVGKLIHEVDYTNGGANSGGSLAAVARISNAPADWRHYLQFAIFFVGCTGARCWTSLLALGLCLLRVRSLCFLLRYRLLIYLTGFSVPIVVTGIFLLACSRQNVKDVDPAFHYGRCQLITSLIVLLVNILATITFLVIQHRYGAAKEYSALGGDEEMVKMWKDNAGCKEDDTKSDLPCTDDAEDESKSDVSMGSMAGEDLDEWIAARTCPQDLVTPERRQECLALLARYRSPRRSFLPTARSVPEGLEEEYQHQRHMILIILLLITMFFGTFLCIWRLVRESISGIYVELEFLDSVFNFGQGFIAFAVFGLDTELIIIPFKKKLNQLIYGVDEFYIPPEEFLDPEVRHTREQFVTHHLLRCRSEIAKDRRHRLVLYRKSFTGTELVDWLLHVGLAPDRIEAVAYGQSLLYGRVIRHVTKEHSLRDAAYLYCFDRGYDGGEESPRTSLVKEEEEK